MYTILHEPRLRAACLREAPSFALALLLAEGVFKFHSFTLECAAFLATWSAASFLGAAVWNWWAATERRLPEKN